MLRRRMLRRTKPTPTNPRPRKPARPSSARAGAAGAEAMEVALAMLGRRSHPASAVRSRIAARFSEEQAERVVARLRELGVLDDAAYAEAFVRDRFVRAGYGRERIRADLRRRGVA